MAQLPLHPRLAHMLLVAKKRGLGPLASDMAALLSERDIVKAGPDRSTAYTSDNDLFDRFLVTGDRVEIRGWAVDPLAQKPAEFVLVTDARQQVLTVCTVDLKRPDVAEQFSNQNLRHAGWAGQIEARSLAAGSFPLHAYVLIAGSETAVALPRNAMAAKAMAEFSRGLPEKTVRDPVPDTTEAGA